MRKLCPNVDKEDGLETVLEVPLPEEMFSNMGAGRLARWQRKWVKHDSKDDKPSSTVLADRNAELHLLLNVVGSPLIPLPLGMDEAFNRPIKDSSIEASTAKYIVHQYLAAIGGQAALSLVNSYYAVGKVRMSASEFHGGDENINLKGNGDVGGFVLWQKNPDLWSLELVVAGCKVSAGSNGKVAWRQMAAQQSHASRGPPRPLRRSLQGLDPKLIASLFSAAVCIGEKNVNNGDCFILKLEANTATLEARGSDNFEIIHHTIWGYFSQRSGLLVQFQDTHLLMVKGKGGESTVFWETTMESVIDDYRYVEGINIAHRGHTAVTLFRYGEGSANHKRRMEETWEIEEVDFNIWGLSLDCFLPPSDLEDHEP